MEVDYVRISYLDVLEERVPVCGIVWIWWLDPLLLVYYAIRSCEMVASRAEHEEGGNVD